MGCADYNFTQDNHFMTFELFKGGYFYKTLF